MRIKTYEELITIPTYLERFNYLKIGGVIGDMTFNGHRYLNQRLYTDPEWKSIRRRVIIRDNGCDMAFDGYTINGKIIVHHINAITIDDILNRDPKVFDLNNLVCVSYDTHNAIHYGSEDLLAKPIIERRPGDTCLWR